MTAPLATVAGPGAGAGPAPPPTSVPTVSAARRAGYAVARRLFPPRAARSRLLRRALLRRTLRQLERALATTGMAGRLWLMGGLAIGYARTGRPLDNDLCDVDLGYADADHEAMMEALDVLARRGFRPTHRLVSNAGVQTAMRLRKDGVWVDLVRCFHGGDGGDGGDGAGGAGGATREYWVTYLTDRHSALAPREVEVQTEVTFQEKVPADRRMLGTSWLRAADLDAYLTEQYGTAWRAPDRVFYANSWDHVRDSPAVVHVETWLGRWEPWTEERGAGMA